MLKQRLRSTAVAFPITIAAFWFGEPWFTGLIIVLAVLSSLELYRLTLPERGRKLTSVVGALCAVTLIFARHIEDRYVLSLVITLIVALPMIFCLFRRQPQGNLLSWAWIVSGAFYIGWLFGYWIDIRALPEGRSLALVVVLATICYDSAAYFVGIAWGKTHLAPSLSPKKTWEGAVGGMLGAVAACLILKVLLTLSLGVWTLALMGIIISVFAQLGDLVVSLFKRNAGVKDAGSLMPGHGGVLDRIGSTIFTAVAAFYFLTWILS